jgi:hypothetical protein
MFSETNVNGRYRYLKKKKKTKNLRKEKKNVRKGGVEIKCKGCRKEADR